MNNQRRKSDTDMLEKSVLNILEEASWGTHVCQFYKTREDLLDILIPYFKAGLENNEFCMWITSEPLKGEEVRDALARAVNNFDDYLNKGQMEIMDYRQWYLDSSGEFESERVLQGWIEKKNQALREGFSGLRASGNTSWLESKDWEAFTAYEAATDNAIHKYHMIALCSYTLQRCGSSEILDAVSNHQLALIRHNGNWEVIQSTRRKRLEEELRQSKWELTLRNRIARVFLTIPDDRMYGELLQVVLEAMKSKQGAFGYINRAGDMAFASFTRDIWDQCRMSDKKIVFPRKAWYGMWGRALLEGKTFRSNSPCQVPGGHIPISRVLVVPIIYQEETIGEVMVANKETDYTEEDQRLLESVVQAEIAPILYARLQRDRHEEERVRAEESVKAAYAELDQIFNTSADGMRLIDKNFTTLRVNETFLTLSQLKEEKVIGQKCYDTFPGSKCHTSDCPMVRILGGEERVEGDCEKIRRDGSRVPCIVTATPFRGPAGELIGMVEDFKDITDRKKMEEELLRAKREAEEKYLSLVKQAKDGIAIVQDKVFKFVNHGLAEITGYTIEELAGMPFLGIVADESKALIAERYTLRMSGGYAPSCYELKIKAKDGTLRDVEMSAVIIQYNGRPADMGVIRDITMRRKMEAELEKVERLESIGVLAGGIAHDFNNSLAAILGSISLAEQLIQSGQGNPLDTLMRAKKASLQASTLTQQLLTFSRGGAPVKKAASIRELLQDTVSFTLRGSKIKDEFFIPDDLWAVEIDKGQISQVINNMIINAEHAMPEGGIIRIYGENVPVKAEDGLPVKPGKYIRISIKDQGHGIPEEYRHRIFDPYFTRKQGGSGLGLTSAFSIIKRHGGYITVESEVGVGTTFYIYLPAIERVVVSVEEIAEVELFTSQGRILVMDDQEEVRETAGAMLAYLGYEVELARDGLEAIELYKRARANGRSFDAVIFDLTIPGGMGGKETIQKILEIDPEVKAIVSSGYSNDPVMSEHARYGFSSMVAKPFEIKELSEVLRHLGVRP